ncbi:MAG: hypothetical protein OES20_01840 [Gammaproteobacteria bacterium]|nr:hypothetical protein [Gammaproteobacteria bacterium]MDH3858953.1 hypothetical protein [Gammaproteobacteria bacterium]
MATDRPDVLRLADIEIAELCLLLTRFGLQLNHCKDAEPIPYSYWGEEEAGLKGNLLYARSDTPIHSILHEACHYICLDPARRPGLDTDAGSDDAEESAVCYLQILLADEISGFGRERMFIDMDTWGYSFRLGTSKAWFELDAGDALCWLARRNLVELRQLHLPRLQQA